MWLIFPGHPSKNGKKPVFVAVDILFSYLDKFFHDFRNFIQTLVNYEFLIYQGLVLSKPTPKHFR
jgi:hypothetical protein